MSIKQFTPAAGQTYTPTESVRADELVAGDVVRLGGKPQQVVAAPGPDEDGQIVLEFTDYSSPFTVPPHWTYNRWIGSPAD